MSAMWKKMLAPILITVLLVAWFAVWLIGCALLPIPWFWKGIGILVSAAWIGRDITQSFKTIIGGELKAYTDMMNEARALATKRMVEEAEQLGADAVINIRYASAAVMQGAAEVIAYGTAVKFK